ncbi:MAG TPA: type II CAAX endopeptidase family protein [Chitinophagales bacterium]|nr:type II CAAX endopeptidase family protein [Chitinophagales bacterium]
MENVDSKGRAWAKVVVATALVFITAIAWVVYAGKVYNNFLPLQDLQFYSLYPIGAGLAAVVTALVFDRSLVAFALKAVKWKYIIWAFILASVITLAPFILNIVLHLEGLNKPSMVFVQLLAIGLPVLFVTTLLEEILWRGIVYNGMKTIFGFNTIALLTGLLTAAWHYPVIIHTRLMFNDKPLGFALIMYTMLTTGLAYVYTYIRKVSGSIWPVVVMHTFINWYYLAIIIPLEKPIYPWSIFFECNIGVLYVLFAFAGAVYYVQVVREPEQP